VSQWEHATTIARRKLCEAPEWTVFSLEVLDSGDFLAAGAIEAVTLGGKKKWLGKEKRATITPAELKAEKKRYEATTGKCAECLGTGKILLRWHHIEGTTYQDCVRCKGTGEAKS